jgi:glucokinase
MSKTTLKRRKPVRGRHYITPATTPATIKSTSKYTIGIDLGGTKVAAALVDSEGRLIAEARKPTVPPEMQEQSLRSTQMPTSASEVRRHIRYVIDAMADAAVEALDVTPKKNLAGIGLASAGPMNLERGTLDYPSNFKGWKIVPIVELLSEALKKRSIRTRIYFQNDAVAAALGEGWVGRAKGCNTYGVITVGTGIGTGMIFNGRPAQSAGMGSEWGHMLVNCVGLDSSREDAAGREVEGLASGTWLMKRALARGFKSTHTADLAQAARDGNSLATELFKDASEALAALLYSLSLGFHPEKFVFSGGMLAVKDVFLPQTIELYIDIMKKRYPEFLAPVQVARLGTQAGVIGAARLPLLFT